MDLIKYDMTDIWAVAGDVIAPDSAKIRQGWGVEVVPRQWWNWFENRQDTNIAYMLQKGFPEWDATTEYIANKSYVQRNGVVYKATSTSTNNDPVNLTAWVRAFGTYTTAGNALDGTTAAADRLPYFTSSTAASTTTLTAWARTLLDDADAASGRATLNAQIAHQNLTGLSGLSASVNGVPYFTATTGAMGIATLTAFGRTLFGAADAANARNILGLDSGSISAVTASNADGTAGRLQRVGDYGWGVGNNGLPAMDLPNGDLNLATLSGVYRVVTGNTNIPAGYGQGSLVTTVMWNNGTGTQTIQQSGKMASRYGSALSGATPTWTGWSEVWTDSTMVKTTSTTDPTVGRMLKVGDFGVGSNAIQLTVDNAMDVVYRSSGWYEVPNNATWSKRPLAGWTRIMHISHGNTVGYASQMAWGGFEVVSHSPRMFSRDCTNGVWSDWVEVYTTANSQGLVDQVAAGIQTKLDAKLNKAGDTMTGKLYTNVGLESKGEIIVRTDASDSAGVTIINNAWEVHNDINGDTFRYFSNRVNNTTPVIIMELDMSTQASRVFGNNIWHSGNFNPSNYSTIEYANSISNSTANNVANSIVQNYTYSKSQSDQKYYVNGSGFLSVVNGAIPNIAAASGSYYGNGLAVTNGGNNGASAAMCFLREGSFGTYFGINTDNSLSWGGWSHGNVAYRVYSEKDFLIGNYSTNTQNNAYFLAQGNFGNFAVNFALNQGAEDVGAYAALGNVSGGTHGLNQIASGNVLRRGGTNQTTGESVPGNWRCMGVVNNGIIGLYKRYN